MSESKYSIIQADMESECEAIIALWTNAGIASPEHQKKKYAWFYLKNPTGKGTAFLLQEKATNELAGTECIGLRNWSIDGKQTRSGIFADLIVLPAHRSLGPAMQMIRRSIEYGEKHLQMLYGFPNKRAAPLFKRTNLKVLGQIVRYARVVRSKHYLQGRLPKIIVPFTSLLLDTGMALHDRLMLILVCRGMTSEWCDSFDKRFDILWDTADKRGRALTIRNRATLEWRHKQCPNAENVKIFTLLDRQQAVLGYIVCTYNDEVISVRDFFSNGKENLQQALFLSFLVAVREMGCKSVTLEFFGDQGVIAGLEKLGFRAREERSVHCSIPALSDVEKHALTWYITSSDEDT